MKTIADLIEFIQRHELDNDTEIDIGFRNYVYSVNDIGVVRKLDKKPIKPRLVLVYEEVDHG